MVGRFIFFILIFLAPVNANGWGFFAHERIHKNAVFQQPPALYAFYRAHINEIIERSVNADKRRYVDEDEAPRHYIDLDRYGKYPFKELPRNRNKAEAKYSADTLNQYGILPWYVDELYNDLVEAFSNKNTSRIIHISADLGHYVSDANSPLHTTVNYNGQLTGQTGIHALWESRLPELFSDEYDLIVEDPYYITDPLETMFEIVLHSHLAVDSLLLIERSLRDTFPEDRVYAYETRGQNQMRVFSRAYCRAYHDAMNGMVERFMKKSILDVASFWYSAWVDAGQPYFDVPGLESASPYEPQPHKEYLNRDPSDFKGRPDK